jgi:hypothetical protein
MMGLGALLCGFTLLLFLLEKSWESPVSLGPQQAFNAGSIGTEFAPLPVITALPKLFPEQFMPLGPDKGDWIEQYGFLRRDDSPLPLGLTVSSYRPQSASPSPVPFVGIGCGTCHTGEIVTADGTRTRISGMGNPALDILAWFEAFRAAVLARDDNGDFRLNISSIEQANGDTLGLAQRAIVYVWMRVLRDVLQNGLRRHDYPYPADTRLNALFHPAGPGRTNPFNTLVTTVLDLPNRSLTQNREIHAFTKIPAVYQEDRRKWAQFDGSIRDLNGRSALAAMTIGATAENLAHEEISRNVMLATDYTRHLNPPGFSQATGASIDNERAQAGKAVYRTYCFSCHGMPDANGQWQPGERMGELVKAEALGVDAERVSIRHAARLSQTLYKRFGPDFQKRYNKVHPLAFAEQDIRPKSALDQGYINAPIEGVYSRAPYLHNASILTLAELINLIPRRQSFPRGNNFYDTQNVGLSVNTDSAAGLPFMFDASRLGNANHGHDYPWAYDDSRRDEAALRNLLEYLKTL